MKKLRRMCEQVDLPKYRTEIAAARVRVLQKILSCKTTSNDQNIMLAGERMDNFAHENDTLFKIELKSRESGWPAKGTPEETTRLTEISNLWIEVVLMKAMIYDRDGGTSASSSQLPCTE